MRDEDHERVLREELYLWRDRANDTAAKAAQLQSKLDAVTAERDALRVANEALAEAVKAMAIQALTPGRLSGEVAVKESTWIPVASMCLPERGQRVDWLAPSGELVEGGAYGGVWLLPGGAYEGVWLLPGGEMYVYYVPVFWRPHQEQWPGCSGWAA